MRHFTWFSIWNRFYFPGSWYLGISHSVNAEDSPKCIRTLFVKSCREDVRGGIFRCSTRDTDQSFWCLSTVFHCSIWILNDKIASLHQLQFRNIFGWKRPREWIRHARPRVASLSQWCSYTLVWRMLGKLKYQRKRKDGKIFNFFENEKDAKVRTFWEDFFSKVEGTDVYSTVLLLKETYGEEKLHRTKQICHNGQWQTGLVLTQQRLRENKLKRKKCTQKI